MTNFSSNSIKGLGKRLRDGDATSQDLDMLDAYRCQFDQTLIENAQSITDIFDQHKIKNLLTGRTKRTKSIIRKLVRDRNKGMDLSRMSDIVGIRVILQSLQDQDRAMELLCQKLTMVREPYDYRNLEYGYRAVHLIAGSPAHRVEIQLRTCAQHYWADESERLGERVKEGNTTPEEAAYLHQLNVFCKAIDDGQDDVAPSNALDLSSGYQRLSEKFAQATKASTYGNASFVVVYHEATNSLIRIDAFTQSQRIDALTHYREVSRALDESEYDILVLNAGSRQALAITHPRYFPESTY